MGARGTDIYKNQKKEKKMFYYAASIYEYIYLEVIEHAIHRQDDCTSNGNQGNEL